MKAAVMYGKEDIRIETKAEPELGLGEVLLKIKATGICGSDLPRFFQGHLRKTPLVLGHEFSGEIVKTEQKEDQYLIGKRAAAVPLLPCYKCSSCQNGYFGLCTNASFIGTKEDGSLTEYISLNKTNLFFIDDNVTYEEAAMFEPSAVALHAVRQAGEVAGKSVLVIGSGNIGQLIIQWSRIFGAAHITAVDIQQTKRDLALKSGAREALEEINDETFDFVFETVGLSQTLETAIAHTSPKGTICYMAIPHKPITMEPETIGLVARKELTLKGTWMSYSAPFPGEEWELTNHYVKNGELKLHMLIDQAFSLEQAEEAFYYHLKKGELKGKVQVTND